MRKAGVGAILITKNEILPISKNPFRTRASSMPVQSFPLYLYRRKVYMTPVRTALVMLDCKYRILVMHIEPHPDLA